MKRIKTLLIKAVMYVLEQLSKIEVVECAVKLKADEILDLQSLHALEVRTGEDVTTEDYLEVGL